MKDITWPSGLPQMPQRSGYLRGTANNSIRMQPDNGRSKTRRVSSANSSSLNVTYLLHEDYKSELGYVADQKLIFDDFYDLVDTSLSFWLPDPEKPERYISVKIKGSNETTGVEIKPFAFRVWSVTLQLEVWPHAFKPRS